MKKRGLKLVNLTSKLQEIQPESKGSHGFISQLTTPCHLRSQSIRLPRNQLYQRREHGFHINVLYLAYLIARINERRMK